MQSKVKVNLAVNLSDKKLRREGKKLNKKLEKKQRLSELKQEKQRKIDIEDDE